MSVPKGCTFLYRSMVLSSSLVIISCFTDFSLPAKGLSSSLWTLGLLLSITKNTSRSPI